MPGHKGRLHVSEKEFNRIKKLQEAGLAVVAAARAIERNPNTVRRIYHTKTYETYTKPRASAPIAKKTSKASEDDFIRLAQNINESLRTIDERLKWIEDHVPVADRKFLGIGRRG